MGSAGSFGSKGKAAAASGGSSKSTSQNVVASAEELEHITELHSASADGREQLKLAITNLKCDSEDATDLQMTSFEIEDAGIVKLSKVLGKSTHLQILNLSINRLTDVGAEALAGTLPATQLRVLMLERNSLTATGVAALAKSLPSTLEKFMLGRNTVGAGGAQALADSVVQFHTLGLGFSHLHPEGAQALLPVLSKVTVLDVSGNHLGGHGCSLIADKLQASPLETLKFESNGIGDTGAKALGIALGLNKNLRMLEVRRNSITDEGAKLLALALETNLTLRHLDLFDNNITDAGASALLASVRKAKKAGSQLNKLELEINDVSPSMMNQIAEAVRDG
jgi:Ran GTPase-activating protein (RanGAP) involved in mRNA processing and transport